MVTQCTVRHAATCSEKGDNLTNTTIELEGINHRQNQPYHLIIMASSSKHQMSCYHYWKVQIAEFRIPNHATLMSFKVYNVRNLEKTIRFSLKSRPSERFHWPVMSQIKAEISLHTNVKLIFHKNVGLQGYQWIPWFL